MTSGTNTRAPRRTDGSFHHIKPIYGEHALSAALASGQITDDDRFVIATYVIEAKTASRAKKEYGSMPKQIVPSNKAFGTKVEDA